jgi:hypothetical protein
VERLAIPAGTSRIGYQMPCWAAQTFSNSHSIREGGQTMPSVTTPEKLAERVCRALNIPAKGNAESVTEILRATLTEAREQAVAATKAACLEIAEDEAERCRSVGATAAQQTAFTIAARIRKRHVEVRS